MPSTQSSSLRTRGRPPMTAADVGKIRERIIEATREVFTRVGYHGLSVELVIAQAGVSRPTFYKYFRSTEEPMEVLISQVNDDLVSRVMQAVSGTPEPMAKVEAALQAWRQWGADLGDFLRPFFAELNDMHSPVGRYRQRTLGVLTEQIARVVELMGRERPGALRVETFLHGVEFLGYRYHLNTPCDDASWEETRAVMFRMALALLGAEADWGNALGLARDWRISLDRT